MTAPARLGYTLRECVLMASRVLVTHEPGTPPRNADEAHALALLEMLEMVKLGHPVYEAGEPMVLTEAEQNELTRAVTGEL